MKIPDAVHGEIHIPPLVQAIIQTDEFQRLKEIKQTGLLYLQFKEAQHSRYDHSIGTYHVAAKTIRSLEENTSDLQISEFYKNCICIAALLHDIGHGPFSHVWEHINDSISHEANAFPIVDSIFKKIPYRLCEDEVQHAKGVELIKSLIDGKPKDSFDGPRFIFEIVSNKTNDIDVDKLDYLKRDHHNLQEHLPADQKVPMDFDELFYGARVSDDRCHIEYRYEDVPRIYNMFLARSTFFIHWYCNAHTQFAEKMLVKVFNLIKKSNLKMSDYFQHFYGGKLLHEINSTHQTEFLRLTDGNVVDALKSISDPGVERLVDIIFNCRFEEYPPEEIKPADLPDECTVQVFVKHCDKLKEDQIRYYSVNNNCVRTFKIKGVHNKKHYFKITREDP